MASNESFVFKKIIYQSNDFVIYSIDDGPHAGKTATGKVNAPAEGFLKTQVNVTGEWKAGKFGPQFAFTEISIPNENKVVHFLTHVVRHIPESVAKEINKKYGNEIWKILDESPEKLLGIKGIGEKKLEKIVKRWADVKDIFHLANMLSPLGVTLSKINAISKHFEHLAIKIINENPYDLTYVPGIGFKLADKVAIGLGMDIHDPRRIQSAIEYCILEKSEISGDTAFRPSEIIEFVREQLGDVGSRVDSLKAIVDLINDQKLLFVHVNKTDEDSTEDRINKDNLITSVKFFKYESDIVKVAANKFNHGRIVEDIEAWIEKYEKKHGITLGDEQKQAIITVNERPSIMALVGYAGTGKTTTSKAMLDLLQEHYGNGGIVCCALSGIAANRIQQKSGFPSGTIHSTFGYRGSLGWEFNRNNKFPANVLVIDESSMVNSEILSRMLEAVDTKKTMIIMIGDPAQLNPIGSANPFADLVEHDLIEKVSLTKIYRQDAGSGLVSIANKVRVQEMPKEINGEFTDFKFNNIPHNRNVLNRISEWSSEHGATYMDRVHGGQFMEAIGTFQIISPMKKDNVELTSGTLNSIIQDIVNPNSRSTMQVLMPQVFPSGDKTPGLEFRVGDKVLHTTNENKETFDLKDIKLALADSDDLATKDKRVMNGQIGVVIEAEKESLIVYYPIEKYASMYTKQEALETLSLGYAITIHKSQGSEYENVMMPVVDTHSRMLNSKLFYTAMTRASKNFEVAGSASALFKACTKNGGSRNTCISQWASPNEPEPVKKEEVFVSKSSGLRF